MSKLDNITVLCGRHRPNCAAQRACSEKNLCKNDIYLIKLLVTEVEKKIFVCVISSTVFTNYSCHISGEKCDANLLCSVF